MVYKSKKTRMEEERRDKLTLLLALADTPDDLQRYADLLDVPISISENSSQEVGEETVTEKASVEKQKTAKKGRRKKKAEHWDKLDDESSPEYQLMMLNLLGPDDYQSLIETNLPENQGSEGSIPSAEAAAPPRPCDGADAGPEALSDLDTEKIASSDVKKKGARTKPRKEKTRGRRKSERDNSITLNFNRSRDNGGGIASVRRGEKIDVEELAALARRGDSEAAYRLGCAYEQGKDAARNARTAVKYYQQAADAGMISALFALALCYLWGSGVRVDKRRAFLLMREAAKGGSSDALYQLGLCYSIGIGTTVDLSKSTKCFHRAAKLGVPAAQYAYARALRRGYGVPVDRQRAAIWLERAAMNGVAAAEKELYSQYRRRAK